jgi:hypothetical protein
MLFNAWSGTGTQLTLFTFNSDDTITYYFDNGANNYRFITNQVFRDCSSWYHIVLAVDTTQSVNTNRAKLYVNGEQVTSFSQYDTFPQVVTYINATNTHNIGRYAYDGTRYFNGYLADIHFIDGAALTPSSFTETDATTGQLIPKTYTGSYGTNGFKLTFSDNSNNTAATLGADTSGNGNNWTPNNLSVTAGAGNDSLVDTPTNYGTDTGAGGEVRGNYATLNPLASAGTMSNGNLDGYNAVNTTSHATFAIPSSGKWYFEAVMTSGNVLNLGLAAYRPNGHVYSISNSVLYSSSGVKNVDGVNDVAYGASFTTGDVIGVACDADAGSVTFYKNGSSQGPITHQVGGLFPSFGNGGIAVNYTVNFGQRQWAYTPPAGFKALCTQNLPAPVIAQPSTVMNIITYTGTGSSLTLPNANSTPTSISFTPEWVWIKGRSGATDHALYDVVRGEQKDLVSNATTAETTQSTGLTAFGTNNFTVGSLAKLNTSSSTYVAWCWDAGSSTVSNTQGSITSQVRANTSAGFSVVTWTGNGQSNATVGHGQNVAPAFIVTVSRDGGSDWNIYHKSLATNNRLFFTTSAAINVATYFSSGGIGPGTSSVLNFTQGTSNVNNANANNVRYLAYVWNEVAGYSSFGSYTGNGSADGPFVFTGFRPRWVMIKNSGGGASSSSQGWVLQDTARSTFNVTADTLFASNANSSSSNSIYGLDILSNGFKTRGTDGAVNEVNATYVYAAFAESPFKYARAR